MVEDVFVVYALDRVLVSVVDVSVVIGLVEVENRLGEVYLDEEKVGYEFFLY
jgi:hypothetical protein